MADNDTTTATTETPGAPPVVAATEIPVVAATEIPVVAAPPVVAATEIPVVAAPPVVAATEIPVVAATTADTSTPVTNTKLDVTINTPGASASAPAEKSGIMGEFVTMDHVIEIAIVAAVAVTIIIVWIYAKWVANYGLPTNTPIGTIIPFGGTNNSVPKGWLLCDGAAYDPNTYADLFGIVQYTYGRSGINFMTPDLRGVFLRGVDAGASRDPGRVLGTTQLSGTSAVIGATATTAGTGW